MRERRDGSTHRTRLRPACQAPVWWTAGRSRRTCGVCAFDCFGTRQVSSGSSVRCVDVDVEATHCVDLYSNGEDSTDSTQFVQKTRCSPPGEHSGQRARERPAGCGRAQPGRPPAAALRRPPLTTPRRPTALLCPSCPSALSPSAAVRCSLLRASWIAWVIRWRPQQPWRGVCAVAPSGPRRLPAPSRRE